MELDKALQLVSMDGFWSADTQGQFLLVNDAYCQLIGYSREELLAMNISDVEAVEDDDAVIRHIEKIIQTGLDRFETRHRCKDGTIKHFEINCSFAQGPVGRFYTFIRDITEHMQVKHELKELNYRLEEQIEQRTRELREANSSLAKEIDEHKDAEVAQNAMIDLLRICNEVDDLRELMSVCAGFFQQQSGCQAVGIRLREGDDFPYFETRGFPDEFVQKENRLCVYDEQGEAIRDYTGNPVLDCMCGNVLCERFDPSKPFFTQHGSFWTSCTSELLAKTTNADRLARTRNRCNGEGYESVALLPFRFRGYTYGLLQLNDKRTGRFNTATIARYENLVDCIAIALAKRMSDEALRTSNHMLQSVMDNLFQFQWMLSPDGILINANSTALSLVGVALSAVAGTYFWETPWWQHDSGLQEKIRDSVVSAAKGEIVRFETTHQDTDGVLHTMDFSLKSIRDSAGKIIYLIPEGHDISYQKMAEENLRSYNDMLRKLTAHIEAARENERKRIAREIHDELGQSLLALKYHNSWLQQRLTSDAAMVTHLKNMESIVDSSMASIRNICRNLRPQMLDDIGLLAAIEWQAKDFRKSSNIKFRLTVDQEVRDLSFSCSESTAIFRIFQEALTNIMRHSGATQAQAAITLRGNRLYVRITDNGRGITDEELAAQDSFGLQGMHERIMTCHDGNIAIRRLKRKGTEVALSLIVNAQISSKGLEEVCHGYPDSR